MWHCLRNIWIQFGYEQNGKGGSWANRESIKLASFDSKLLCHVNGDVLKGVPQNALRRKADSRSEENRNAICKCKRFLCEQLWSSWNWVNVLFNFLNGDNGKSRKVKKLAHRWDYKIWKFKEFSSLVFHFSIIRTLWYKTIQIQISYLLFLIN